MESSVLVWMRFSAEAPLNKWDYIKCKFPVVGLTLHSLSQEGTNEVGAPGPSGDFEIPDVRRNDLGSEMPVNPDLTGNTVDGGSSAAQLPQKNILERKEVLIGKLIKH